MKKLFISFAAFAALVSCVKESPVTGETPDADETPVVEETIVSITAVGPEVADPNSTSQQQNAQSTKTQLVDGTNVQWAPGDAVKVCFEPLRGSGHVNATKNGCTTVLTYNGSNPAESAVFSGAWAPANSSLLTSYGVVVYPGNSNFSFSSSVTGDWVYPTTTISYTIPTEQEAIEGTFANDLNLSYAILKLSDMSSNTAKAQFKNLCSVFCVTLPATEYNVKSIKLEVDNNTNSTYMTGLSSLELSSSALKEKESASSSKPTYVVLKKADGSTLTPGASYYAVVWAHNYRGVKLTFTNTEGKEATKTASKDAWIIGEAGKMYKFNISSLSFAAEPYLNVGATSITANAKGSTDSFNVSANNPVTVSVPNDQNWLSASYENGQCTITAQRNKESNTRNSTVTITSGGLTKTVSVSQAPVYYNITGSVKTKASDLEKGKMYVARLHSNRSNYWSTNGSELKIYNTSSSDIPTPCVFTYERDDNKNVGIAYGKSNWLGSGGGNYSYMSAGAWKSMYNDKYISHTFTMSTSVAYFTILNGWRSDKGSSLITSEDMDIYKANNSEMLNYSGGFYWGNGGTDKYKWAFYEVVEK